MTNSINLPKGIQRDDTEHGVDYYTAEDVRALATAYGAECARQAIEANRTKGANHMTKINLPPLGPLPEPFGYVSDFKQAGIMSFQHAPWDKTHALLHSTAPVYTHAQMLAYRAECARQAIEANRTKGANQMTEINLPPLPANLLHVLRRIRACESEVPAQVVLEHILNAYGAECARAAVPDAAAVKAVFRDAMDWGRSYGMRLNLDEMTRDDVASGFAGKALAAAPTAPQQSAQRGVPDGWVLVPVDPTDEMLDATYVGQHCSDIWRDMLAAAPTAPQQSAQRGVPADATPEEWRDAVWKVWKLSRTHNNTIPSHWLDAMREAALAAAPTAPQAAAQAEPQEADQVCAEAYQVVGSLLADLGVFDTDYAEKILDNLSHQKMVHKDVLPWPSFEKPAPQAQPAAQARKCVGDQGECKYNEACMYACGGPVPDEQPTAQASSDEPYAYLVEIKTDAGLTKFFTAPSDPRGFPVFRTPAIR